MNQEHEAYWLSLEKNLTNQEKEVLNDLRQKLFRGRFEEFDLLSVYWQPQRIRQRIRSFHFFPEFMISKGKLVAIIIEARSNERFRNLLSVLQDMDPVY